MTSNDKHLLRVDFNNLKTVIPILLIFVLRSPPLAEAACVFYIFLARKENFVC